MDPVARIALQQLQQRRMHLSDLAEKADVHISILSRWFNGKRTVKLDQALRVMAVLGMTVVVNEPQENGTQRRDIA